MKDYKMAQANDDSQKHYDNYDFIKNNKIERCEFCQQKKYIQNTPIGFCCNKCFKEITRID